MQVTWVLSLGGEDPLETGMATHFSILAWRIPWTEGPGGLQSMGLQRVRHKWTNTFTFRQKSKCRGALRLQSLCSSTVYQNSSEMKFSLNLQFFLSICFTVFMSLTEHYFLKILNSNTIVKKNTGIQIKTKRRRKCWIMPKGADRLRKNKDKDLWDFLVLLISLWDCYKSPCIDLTFSSSLLLWLSIYSYLLI